jgi:hypothetical protein
MLRFRRQSPIVFTCAAAAIVSISIASTAPVTATPQDSEWDEPVNLGPVVNSTANDLAPAVSKDGLSLYFQSNRSGGIGAPDLWVSRRSDEDAEWGPPVNLGEPINSPFTEGAPAFSRDGHWLFFNSERPGGAGGTDMWVAWRANIHDDFGWEMPVNLSGLNTLSGDSIGSYFENEEGGAPLLFFASNRPFIGPAGVGGPYVSALNADGTFGPPTPVTELDSPEDDMRPMIRFDGREIFLVSNRMGTLGGRDLWVSVRETVFDPWSPPVNLGIPVNTGAFELTPYLSADGLSLYFGSNRVVAGAAGAMDLYVTHRDRR